MDHLQVMTRHREASPECPFVKNDSGNVPLQSVNSEDSSSQQEEAEAQQERPPAIPSSPGDSRARDGTGGPEEAMDESVAREAAPDAAASSSSFPEGRGEQEPDLRRAGPRLGSRRLVVRSKNARLEFGSTFLASITSRTSPSYRPLGLIELSDVQ